MVKQILTTSHLGRQVPIWSSVDFDGFASAPQSTLILGGTHGDERATVVLLERFLEYMGHTEQPSKQEATAAIAVIPNLNPDGYAANTRVNGRGVDLNRNFPAGWRIDSEEPPGSEPLSENESKALYDWVIRHQPQKIVSLHWALAELDADGDQSRGLVYDMYHALSAADQKTYRCRVTASNSGGPIEAPPGSFGQWAGHQLLYDNKSRPGVVTLELPYLPYPNSRPDPIPEPHLKWLDEHWKKDAEAYLDYVWVGVKVMCEAAINHQLNANRL